MPIDARIPLGIQPYQSDPLGDYGKVLTLQNLMQQRDMLPRQAQREEEEFGLKKEALQLEREKSQFDMKAGETDRQLKTLDVLERIGATMVDEPTYQQGKEALMRIAGPDLVNQMPPNFDGNFIGSKLAEISRKKEEITNASEMMKEYGLAQEQGFTGLMLDYRNKIEEGKAQFREQKDPRKIGVVNIQFPDGTVKGFQDTDEAGIFEALQRGGTETNQSALPQPPVDMRYNQNNELEVVPGSKTDIKNKATLQKAKTELSTTEEFTGALMRDIDQLLGDPNRKKDGKPAPTKEHPGLESSLGMFQGRSFYPTFAHGQGAVDANSLIESLKNKLSVQGLTKIRQSGTAPGSITEKEWPIFQSAIGNIDKVQSGEQFKDQLRLIREAANNFREAAKTNYQNMTENNQSPANNIPPPPAGFTPD